MHLLRLILPSNIPFMRSVIMLTVIMLNIVAPINCLACSGDGVGENLPPVNFCVVSVARTYHGSLRMTLSLWWRVTRLLVENNWADWHLSDTMSGRHSYHYVISIFLQLIGKMLVCEMFFCPKGRVPLMEYLLCPIVSKRCKILIPKIFTNEWKNVYKKVLLHKKWLPMRLFRSLNSLVYTRYWWLISLSKIWLFFNSVKRTSKISKSLRIPNLCLFFL